MTTALIIYLCIGLIIAVECLVLVLEGKHAPSICPFWLTFTLVMVFWLPLSCSVFLDWLLGRKP